MIRHESKAPARKGKPRAKRKQAAR